MNGEGECPRIVVRAEVSPMGSAPRLTHAASVRA